MAKVTLVARAPGGAMIPTAGRTVPAPPRLPTGRRGSPAAVLGALLALCALVLGLTACGGSARAGESARSADLASWTGTRDGARAVDRQADAQRAAAAEAERCTTRPEDRAACTRPEGARSTPGGGDLDGDGVFERHEPVGPGFRDPRAYDGGPTSGETQCEWARKQGHGC